MNKRPVTASECIEAANKAHAEGYTELAEIFENIADKISAFNETHSTTVEEIRARLGEEKFWAMLTGEDVPNA